MSQSGRLPAGYRSFLSPMRVRWMPGSSTLAEVRATGSTEEEGKTMSQMGKNVIKLVALVLSARCTAEEIMSAETRFLASRSVVVAIALLVSVAIAPRQA